MKSFKPNEKIKNNAYIGSVEKYNEIYDYSIKDPEGFWAEQAERITWFKKWNKRLENENQSRLKISQNMLNINPIYIPRNHLVESVIHEAVQENNFSKMKELLELVREPYKEKKSKNSYGLPPKPEEVVKHTYCGT